MNLSLNKLRIILLSLMGIGLGVLIAVAPVGFALLAGINILGFVWLVAEAGTHASYTMAIGNMLNQLFKPKLPRQQMKGGTIQVTNDAINGNLSKSTETEERSGQDLQNGKVIGEIKPVDKTGEDHPTRFRHDT